MITKKDLLFLVLLFSHIISAQNNYDKIPDSLSTKNFDYLSNATIAHSKDSIKSRIYTKVWLEKAKSEKNNYQLALAYKAQIHQSKNQFRLRYTDSMLMAAKKSNDIELIGSAYMTRGIVHYDRKEQMKALDNYLIADKYIARTKNNYLIYKLKYGIAQTKSYLGFYDEAISLFRECIDYFKEENDRAYLNSLHSLGLCYNRIGNYAWCTIINQTGIDEGKRVNNLEMQLYFKHSEGVNLCGKQNYRESISKLTAVLQVLQNKNDFANLSVAYFYIGKSLWLLNKKDKAIIYFKKVDEIFKKEKYIRPDLREGYEKLIAYYKKEENTKAQLFYIDQLLQVDNVLGQNYKYLLKKVVKEYDTKELLRSKQEIEKVMKFKVTVAFGIIFILITVIVFLIYKHFKNKRLFKKIMTQDTKIGIASKTVNKTVTQDISQDIEERILKKLQKFEKESRFLEKDMTLARMALLLNTNTKYVTRIIAKHRGKGTIEYITDLKINYIVEKLKLENRYRNYTNKALGEEAGFRSTQNFTRAFKERTGFSPTYFINKLKKATAKNN